MKTLLEIIQQTCNELGLQQPISVVSSQDQQTKQLFALANAEGRELLQSNGWTALQTEFNISIGLPTTQTGTVTNGSRLITGLTSTAGIDANTFAVSGTYIPQAARVVSVDSPTQVTMSMEAVGSSVGSIVFARDTFEIPTDFNNYINRTWWDRTMHWELRGPVSPQEWQWINSGVVTTGPRRRFRQIGHRPGVFRIWPVPTSSDAPADLVFEYISTDWALGADDVYKPEFTADDDISVFDPWLFVRGIKWRFFQIKGFDWETLYQEYKVYRERSIGRDGGRPTLNMSRRRSAMFLSPANVQDGSWPS